MCKVLGVSNSGYYRWISAEPSKRKLENKMLKEKICESYKGSKERYGSPRIAKELQAQGINVSRPRVARIMQKEGLQARKKRKFKVTTDSKHNFKIAENKLDRNFEPGQIAKAWVSDITYIATEEGWLYLTTVIDLGDRKVIGWSLSDSMATDNTVLPALRMAVMNRAVQPGLIFHSDRGVQYACTAFTNALRSHQMVQSMSGKGNCWDNAVAESFFKSMKVECVYNYKFKTREEAELVIFEYIEVWYNRQRRHSALGYLTPHEYGQLISNNNSAA